MGPVLFILWILAQSHPHWAVPQLIRSGQMSMFSVYVGPEAESVEQELRVQCKTDRSLNNLEAHIPIEAVVREDVVSAAGHILIPTGSKVMGQGYCDAERGRVLGRGRWTFYVSDHKITADGTMWDKTRKEGLEGTEFSDGIDESRVKQAIYRDGIYLYVASETEFVLQVKGSISVQDLPSAHEK